MILRWWQSWTGPASDRAGTRTAARRPIGFEPMEGRVLLSAGGARPYAVARQARVAAFQQARLAQSRASGVHENGAPRGDHVSLDEQVVFPVKTVVNARQMAASNDVRKVGVSYAKLGVSHDTRKVGEAYIKAAIRGDGKTLDNLGHTRLVKKVGDDFERLSNTRLVRKVGDAFSSFGKSVADQFNKLFLNDSNDPPKRAKPRPAAAVTTAADSSAAAPQV